MARLALWGVGALTLVWCLTTIIPSAEAIDCYADVGMTVQEDCQMHTGCIKRFHRRTQKTISRGCFLTPGMNDTCGINPVDKTGYCYCHTDLCNAADSQGVSSLNLFFSLIVLGLAF